MKKKLLFITSFIMVASSLIGCGQTSISHKASNSMSSIVASSSIPFTYDKYWGVNYESTDTKGVDNFANRLSEDGYIDMHGDRMAYYVVFRDQISNVTPREFPKYLEDVQMFYIKDTGIFIQTSDDIYCYKSTIGSKTILMIAPLIMIKIKPRTSLFGHAVVTNRDAIS